MQKLVFEDAWNRTISTCDREHIINEFKKLTFTTNESPQFTPLWKATNHKNELLVTTLIHNCSTTDFTLKNELMSVNAGNRVVATHQFTLPIKLHAHTSMPWTFIFPVDHLNAHVQMNQDVQLILSLEKRK